MKKVLLAFLWCGLGSIISLSCDNFKISVSTNKCEPQHSCEQVCQGLNCQWQCVPNPSAKGCDSNCDSCDPGAKTQIASLSLANNETCPVTTTHSNTYETPGCWCNIIFVGRRCCHCLNNCYTTDTWTTTEHVPAPPYGSCP